MLSQLEEFSYFCSSDSLKNTVYVCSLDTGDVVPLTEMTSGMTVVRSSSLPMFISVPLPLSMSLSLSLFVLTLLIALHELNAAFSTYSRSRRFRQLTHDLGVRHPLLAQSMYIFKVRTRFPNVLASYGDVENERWKRKAVIESRKRIAKREREREREIERSIQAIC